MLEIQIRSERAIHAKELDLKKHIEPNFFYIETLNMTSLNNYLSKFSQL